METTPPTLLNDEPKLDQNKSKSPRSSTINQPNIPSPPSTNDAPLPNFTTCNTLKVHNPTTEKILMFKPELTPLSAYFYTKTGFLKKSSAWKPFKPKLRPFNLTHFTLVTFNIWFNRIPERAKGLIQLVLNENPDFICLQEVTPFWFRYWTNHPKVRESYFISDFEPFKTVWPYGCAILSRHKPLEVGYLTFPTKYQRKLLFLHFQLGTKKFAIGTVHLDSMSPDAPYRKAQLQIATDFLTKQNDMAILCGDFNFSDTFMYQEKPENENIPSNWGDTWLELGLDPQKGFTYDKNRNSFAKHSPGRIDRICFLKNTPVSPTSIKLFGTEPFSPGIYPSDHFGLLAQFSVRALE